MPLDRRLMYSCCSCIGCYAGVPLMWGDTHLRNHASTETELLKLLTVRLHNRFAPRLAAAQRILVHAVSSVNRDPSSIGGLWPKSWVGGVFLL
ncbi:hypothetical protein N656DRAFT_785005 [Canariomyces notabilis]|uniref:Uncharacterized protein n=1 Tax=Canariomyces notabilis TaxID=2074819 RepID=A0AAN6T7I6_9PEZI|nr:hypothetical protein N656DRAFT_785005 [Canariomyces arenarius]